MNDPSEIILKCCFDTQLLSMLETVVLLNSFFGTCDTFFRIHLWKKNSVYS